MSPVNIVFVNSSMCGETERFHTIIRQRYSVHGTNWAGGEQHAATSSFKTNPSTRTCHW